VAIGTVAGGEIHLHASVGREKDAWTGCIRERARAYLVVEGVVLELTGHAWREMDRDLGVKTPHYEDLAISP
jgi:predicted DNA-binding protein with PD1-like motif